MCCLMPWLLQMLKKPGPYPMIALPPGGGYWVDGVEHNCQLDTEGNPVLSDITGKPMLEMDETAKCYRRHMLGKVWWVRMSIYMSAHDAQVLMMVSFNVRTPGF